MLVALAFFLGTGGYWLWTGQAVQGAVAALNALLAALVCRRLRDAPRAVWGWFAFCLLVSGYFVDEGDTFCGLSTIVYAITPVVAHRDLKKGDR